MAPNPHGYRDHSHIKSFAIRATRMSPAQRRNYDELRHTYCVPYSDTQEDPRGYFPDPGNRLLVDIGFGMGDATAEMAASMPDTRFLGIEVHKPGVGKLLGAIRRRGLENIRIVQEDAVFVVENMIPPGLVDGFLLFFPDPWPKKRHHKRRIVRRSFVSTLAERLVPGGFIYSVTDWAEYADEMLKVYGNVETLKNAYDGFAPRLPWRPVTSFEKKGVRAGREIRELYFVRL